MSSWIHAKLWIAENHEKKEKNLFYGFKRLLPHIRDFELHNNLQCLALQSLCLQVFYRFLEVYVMTCAQECIC